MPEKDEEEEASRMSCRLGNITKNLRNDDFGAAFDRDATKQPAATLQNITNKINIVIT